MAAAAAAVAAASTDCWAEGLQLGNEAQFEEGHSDCGDESSSHPSQTDPSSSALQFLKNVKLRLGTSFCVSHYGHSEWSYLLLVTCLLSFTVCAGPTAL